jgi:hypothetical protein
LVWGTIPLGQLTGGVLASTIGLRGTMFVGAAGSALAVLPVVLSPIRSLREIPEPEEVLPTIAAGEGGLAPLVGGVDTTGATSGAGPAAATDR